MVTIPRARQLAQRANQILFEPGQTLSQRVVRGGFWVFALRIVSRGLSLVRTVVLARLLAPKDFGLMVGARAVYHGSTYKREANQSL